MVMAAAAPPRDQPASARPSTERLTIADACGILNRMVEQHRDRLDAVFGALSDRTRRRMLRLLAQRERSVGELAAPFEMSLAAASKHIKVLESAGLVRREIEGRSHRVRLEAAPLHAGVEWLRHYERFWSASLDRLSALLQAEDAAAPAAARPAPRPRPRRTNPGSTSAKRRRGET